MQGAPLGLYVLSSLALIATPGQDMLYVVSRALAQGRWAGVCSAAGVCIGILVHTALVSLGVGALLQASETLFVALKLAGAAYLAYLGVRLILARPAAAAIGAGRETAGAAALIGQGIVSNVTNPKVILFFVAFLPQFVDPASAAPARDLALLGVLYAALAFPVKAGIAIAAGRFSERILRAPGALAWANRVSGTVLVALGARLAAAPRG